MSAIKELKDLAQVFDSNIRIGDVTLAGGYVDCRILAANTQESHDVPTGAKYVRVTVTGDVFINIGGTAAIVAADITNGTSSILMVNALPRVFALGSATTIGVIASAVQTVVLEFYS